MGWFDGYPFTSRDDRERRRKEFEKRVVPFGVEEQRIKLKKILAKLFPKVSILDATFAFYDAKDAYTSKDTEEEGCAAARAKLRRNRWIDGRNEAIMLRFIELESAIESLDDYPTADDVFAGLFEE